MARIKLFTESFLNVKSIITSFFQKMFESAPSHQLADIISAIVNATFKEKLDVLNAVDLKDRYLLIRIHTVEKFLLSNFLWFRTQLFGHIL